jgi:hypothetical protein
VFDPASMSPEVVAADMDTVLDPGAEVTVGQLVDIRVRS